MKILLTVLVLTAFLPSKSQTVCGTATENATLTLTAPPGNKIINIQFASYGTPNGACGSFSVSSCHSATSTSIATSTFVGHTSASIVASNGVFGDPCVGTVKRLSVEAGYSAIVPLKLISFTAQQTEQGIVKLEWVSENEVNVSHFIVERSTDGILFETAGTVNAKGNDKNSYSFINSIPANISTAYYRLKIVDNNEKIEFSTVVRVTSTLAGQVLSVYPNPGEGIVTISSTDKQVFISNSTGQFIKAVFISNGRETVNTTGWPGGVYFIRSSAGTVRFLKK